MNRSDLKTIEDRKIALKNALKKDGYTHAAKLLTGLGCASHTDAEIEARKRDVLSHFILRLAYSQNPELRKWFVAMEVEYMKMRITSLNNEGMAKLLAINNFTYKPVSFIIIYVELIVNDFSSYMAWKYSHCKQYCVKINMICVLKTVLRIFVLF